MSDMRALTGTLAVLLLIGTGQARAQTATVPCPTADEVKQTIQNWRVESNQKAMFPAKAVDRFEFSPIRMGRPTKADTHNGAVDACPVRVTYSFVTTLSTGQEMKATHGAYQTFFFYKDFFDEWTFVTTDL